MEKVKFLLNKKLELNKGKLWRKIQKRYRLKWLKMLWSRKLNNINLKLLLDNKKKYINLRSIDKHFMGKLYDLKEATYRFFEKKRKEKIDEDKKKDVYEYTYSNKDKNFLEQEFIERDDRGDVVVKPGDRKLKEEINIKKN